MPGWETLLASFMGLVLGVGIASMLLRRRERAWARRQVALETRVRRVLVPVLERRADVLAIPPAQRGSNDEGAIAVAFALAEAIKTQEESAELPFGDTVEVARDDLRNELGRRSRDA